MSTGKHITAIANDLLQEVRAETSRAGGSTTWKGLHGPNHILNRDLIGWRRRWARGGVLVGRSRWELAAHRGHNLRSGFGHRGTAEALHSLARHPTAGKLDGGSNLPLFKAGDMAAWAARFANSFIPYSAHRSRRLMVTLWLRPPLARPPGSTARQVLGNIKSSVQARRHRLVAIMSRSQSSRQLC